MNNFLSPLLSNPAWFIPFCLVPVFILIWLIVTYSTSRTGGWGLLSRYFPAGEKIEGDTYRFASGSFGRRFLRVKYSNSLFLIVGRKGLYISVFMPFRFMHPPLLIPWSQIESANTKLALHMFEYVEIVIKNKWSVLQLRGIVSKRALEAFTKYSQEIDSQRSNWRNK